MSITNPAPSIKKIKIKVLAQFTGQEQMVVEYVHSFWVLVGGISHFFLSKTKWHFFILLV